MTIILKKLLFYIVLTFGLIFFAACEKRDPAPEAKDPVYKETAAQLDLAKVDLGINNREIDEINKSWSLSKPQTGEGKVYEKRLNEAKNIDVYLKQRVRFYEIALEERKMHVQRKYLESLLPNGRPWPDQKEIEDSLLKLSLYAKRSGRVEKKKPDVPRGTPAAKPENQPIKQ